LAVAVPERMLSFEASDQTIPPLDAVSELLVPPWLSGTLPDNVELAKSKVKPDPVAPAVRVPVPVIPL